MSKAKLTMFINGEPLYQNKPVELENQNGEIVMSFEDTNAQISDHKISREMWTWNPLMCTRLSRRSSVIEMDFDANQATKTMIYSPFGDVERVLKLSEYRYQGEGGEYRFDMEYYFEDQPETKTRVIVLIIED